MQFGKIQADEQAIIDTSVNAESAFEADSIDNITLSDGEDEDKLSTGAKIEKAFKKFQRIKDRMALKNMRKFIKK